MLYSRSPAVGSEDEVHFGIQELGDSSQKTSLEKKTDKATVSIETIGWTSEHEDSVCGQSPAGELATLSFLSPTEKCPTFIIFTRLL